VKFIGEKMPLLAKKLLQMPILATEYIGADGEYIGADGVGLVHAPAA
jgi:hypothetical protein